MKKLHLAIIAAVITAIVIAAVFCVLSPAEHPQNVVQIYCNTPDAQITFLESDDYNSWTARFIDGVVEYRYDPYPHQIKPESIAYRVTAPGYFEATGAFTVEYELNWMAFSVDLVRRS